MASRQDVSLWYTACFVSDTQSTMIKHPNEGTLVNPVLRNSQLPDTD